MSKWILYACVSVALASGYGCDTGTADTAAGATIRVADITGNPDKYVNQTVTVVADVEEVHTPMAFSLDEDSPAAGGVDNDLLVLSPKAAALTNIDDTWLKNKVRVTGTVERMPVTEVERELGWDLSPELEVEIERGRPVLIAKSVQRTQ